MKEEKIEKFLKENENVELIDIFEYKNSNYAKAAMITDTSLSYVYYNIKEDQIIKEEDEELLEEIKKTHERKRNKV